MPEPETPPLPENYFFLSKPGHFADLKAENDRLRAENARLTRDIEMLMAARDARLMGERAEMTAGFKAYIDHLERGGTEADWLAGRRMIDDEAS